jgi:hypothetical protein
MGAVRGKVGAVVSNFEIGGKAALSPEEREKRTGVLDLHFSLVRLRGMLVSKVPSL